MYKWRILLFDLLHNTFRSVEISQSLNVGRLDLICLFQIDFVRLLRKIKDGVVGKGKGKTLFHKSQ